MSSVGADVCGFTGRVSEDLCVRWHQTADKGSTDRFYGSLLMLIDSGSLAKPIFILSTEIIISNIHRNKIQLYLGSIRSNRP